MCLLYDGLKKLCLEELKSLETHDLSIGESQWILIKKWIRRSWRGAMSFHTLTRCEPNIENIGILSDKTNSALSS